MEKIEPNKNYCTLYITRHGETMWNKKRIMQGWLDSPLTKKGKKQADKVGKRLKDIKFHKIFSSDLLRAKRTAEIIRADKQIAIVTTKAIRERSLGKHDGVSLDAFLEEMKDRIKLREKLEAKSLKQSFKLRMAEGWETDEELMARFITFLREISVAYKNKNILVVTHGAIMRVLLVHLGYDQPHKLTYSSIKNSAFVKILCDGTDFFIKETHGITKNSSNEN